MATAAIQRAVIDAAARYGVDQTALLAIQRIEDPSGNPSQTNNEGSGATGIFQFTSPTARQYGLTDRTDINASADAAARLMRDNTAALTAALGRAPTTGELYLAHQQGAGGAITLLTHPDTPATQLVGNAAVTMNGGNANMTGSQFAGIWTNRANQIAANIPPANVPEVASAYADTSLPPPAPRSRSAALAAIAAATAPPVPLAPNYYRQTADMGLATNPVPFSVPQPDLNVAHPFAPPMSVADGAALMNPAGATDFGQPNRSGSPDERSTQLAVGQNSPVVPSAPLAPSLTEAQRNAILAVPQQGMPPLPPVDPRSIAPIPLMRPASITPPTGAAPIPMPASARPVAADTVAAPPSVAAPTAQQTVQINRHTYIVGQPIQDAAGYTYVPQANGTMLKMQHLSLGQNTVAGGIVRQKIKEALPQVNAAVNGAVDNAKSAVSGAASAVGDKVGGFFGSLGGMFGNHAPAAPPTMPTPPASSSYAPGQMGVNPSATNSGAYSELLAQAADQRMLPPLSSNSGMSSPAGGYANPPLPPPSTVYHPQPMSVTPPSAYSSGGSNYSSPGYSQAATGNVGSSYSSNYGVPGYSGNSSYGPDSYAPSIANISPLDLSSYSAPPVAPTYKTITNPAYTEWENGYTPTSGADPYALSGAGSSAGNYGASTPVPLAPLPRAPAPQQYLRVQVTGAAPVAPVYPMPAPPPGLQTPDFLGGIGKNIGNFYNGTPIGHLTNFLTGNSGASTGGGLLSLFGGGGQSQAQSGGLLGGLHGLLSGGPSSSAMLNGVMTPNFNSAGSQSTPQAAIAAGHNSYTDPVTNALMPAVTISGQPITNYSSGSGGSLASRG
jgi:hypothetical protein